MIVFTIFGLVFYIIPGFNDNGLESLFRLGILLVIPLLIMYNGEKGKKSFLMKLSIKNKCINLILFAMCLYLIALTVINISPENKVLLYASHVSSK